jgi:TetR/AcrR family transcriptional repressor of nem operon
MTEAIWERSYSSSSVDSICERAGVRKGSFYHFFKSKTALALAALEHLWETQSKPALDDIFSPSRPPLARFERLIDHWYERALECRQQRGRVLGCPYFNLGSETAAAEPQLTSKAGEILDRYQRYLESALHEANARGDVQLERPEETAACIFSLIEGCSTQARIHNDPERVRHFAGALGRLLGADIRPQCARSTGPADASLRERAAEIDRPLSDL